MTQHRLPALLREPILHFVLLGALAFVAYAALAPAVTKTIVIRPEIVDGLEAQREEILGRPLTEEERSEIVERLIEDEILVREAYRRGLDRSDSRVRERLLVVMRYSLDEVVPDPDRDQLEAYFREHIDRYWDEETITFEHAFFPGGSEATPTDDAAFLATLTRGDYTPPDDPLEGILEVRSTTPGEIRAAMGPESARRVLALVQGAWNGPIDSPLGVHYVKITKRQPLPKPTFDAMLAYVRGDWELDRRREIQSRKVAEIGKNYRVVVMEE
jgi:hypothetical protein